MYFEGNEIGQKLPSKTSTVTIPDHRPVVGVNEFDEGLIGDTVACAAQYLRCAGIHEADMVPLDDKYRLGGMLDKNTVFLLGTPERFFDHLTIRNVHQDTLDAHDLSVFADRPGACASLFDGPRFCQQPVFRGLIHAAEDFKKLLQPARQVIGMNF
jgi:hypothetical protein